MLRQVAGKGEQLVHQHFQPRNLRIVKVHPRFGHPRFGHIIAPIAPDGGGEPGGHIFGHAQRLAHFADGAARAVMDNRAGNSRPFAAIAGVDILDHLLAPLMFEIHVDIGRFLARFGQKAAEQQLFAHRIDRGDAEEIAHQRIGCAAPALAQYRRIKAARMAHDVVYGQEVEGVVVAADQGEFFVQHRAVSRRQAIGKERPRTVPRDLFQPILRFPPLRHGFVRIFVFQIVQREGDA